MKKIDNSSTAILLSKKKWAIIDTEDLERVERHHWTCVSNGAGGNYGYCNLKVLDKKGRVKYVMYMLQRFVLNLGIRGDRPEVVVFLDGDSLNCRKKNLAQMSRRRSA